MTTKVKAPIGYHFMVRGTDNDFYLMKTHFKGYVKHTSGEYVSSLEIDVEVKGQHIPSGTSQTTSVSTSASGARTTTRTIQPTRSTRIRYNSNGTSSSSGGSSGGGGY